MKHEPCCCNYGAAVSGEWPEFECHKCPKHGGAMSKPDELCRRHAKEAARADNLRAKGIEVTP